MRTRPQVFAIGETYPHFVDSYVVREAKATDPEKLRVRVGIKVFGILVCWEGEGQIQRWGTISWKQTKGALKGMKVVWTFNDDGSGAATVVTITAFTQECPVSGLLLRPIVKKTIQRILQDLNILANDPHFLPKYKQRWRSGFCRRPECALLVRIISHRIRQSRRFNRSERAHRGEFHYGV
jgi:ribosome-associated toxin RatA of RatAB toxin-antitoxin module